MVGPPTGSTPTLRNVLWIGGPPASGKTTVARRLARGHGLRWYGADLHVWEHRDRALAAGLAAALRWQHLTQDERFVETSPAELDALLLERERGPMILDDLRSLPAAPLIVAEGTPVLPSLVAATDGCDRAIWLLPEPRLQQSRLAAQGPPLGVVDGARAVENWIRRAAHVAAVVEREAAEHDVPMLVIDASQDETDVMRSIEVRFSTLLRQAPHATTRVERRGLIRYENVVGARHHLAFLGHVPTAGHVSTSHYGFSCECGVPDCDLTLRLTVPDFLRAIEVEGTALLAPGHR